MKTLVADEFYGIREARQNFAEMVRRAHGLLQRFVITNRGKPEAVLIGIEDYQEMMEIIEELSNPALAARVAEERASCAATGGIAFEDYRKDREARGDEVAPGARASKDAKGTRQSKDTRR